MPSVSVWNFMPTPFKFVLKGTYPYAISHFSKVNSDLIVLV